MPLSSRVQIEQALAILNTRADETIRRAGSQVFVTTAVSQNGSLDAFLVLAAQSKLVWQIAHIYSQRPTLRDLLYLYANVASTAFIASELEDIDVAEQLQPVIASVVGLSRALSQDFKPQAQLWSIPLRREPPTLFLRSVLE